jgi:glucuronokinase
MIVKTHAFPRAAVIGNPSDGYFGKTIAFTFANFQADVTIYSTAELEILPARRDRSRYESLDQLADDVSRYGYYGGIRLLKGTLKRFYDYCTQARFKLHANNFSIRYHTSIPPYLGLAGSSAIVTACMRALMAYFRIAIEKPALANLILSVETDELGIGAGLQDRVAQVYQGMMHMDFDSALMESQGHGRYTRLDSSKLPNLYIAFRRNLAEGTEVVHNDLRFRWDRGDSDVHTAMQGFATLTDEFRSAMESGDTSRIATIMNDNFDLRRSIVNINPNQIQVVEAARSVGASAKFTGSGGAIIGTYADNRQYDTLSRRLEKLGMQVIRPMIAEPEDT